MKTSICTPACGTHACTKCGVEKQCGDFYTRGNITKNGRDRRGERIAHCKECSKGLKRDYVRNSGNWERFSRLRWKFGVDERRYYEMLADQGGGCGICGRTTPNGRGTMFAVDHDHACCPGDRSCGECVRGLLCAGCNAGIAMFADRSDLLESAIKYLVKKGHCEQLH